MGGIVALLPSLNSELDAELETASRCRRGSPKTEQKDEYRVDCT